MSDEWRSLFSDGEIGDRVLWVLRVRSLVDLGNRRSGFVGDEGRSLFDLREWRSGFVGDEGAICPNSLKSINTKLN